MLNQNLDSKSLIEFIKHDLLLNRANEHPIYEDTNLIDAGVIDSLSLIQLVTHLEKKTNLTIPDEDVTPDHFQSVATIIKYLNQR